VVNVDMTPTSPGCPSGAEIMADADRHLRALPGRDRCLGEPRVVAVLESGPHRASRQSLPRLLSELSSRASARDLL
jgi:metal-sulfur cluster biosynthetic enzyme